MHHTVVTTVGAPAPLAHRFCCRFRSPPSSPKLESWPPLIKLCRVTTGHVTKAPLPRIQDSSRRRGFAATAKDIQNNSLLFVYRTCCSTSASLCSSWKQRSSAETATTAAAGEPELISIDAIEIETTRAEEGQSTTLATATDCVVLPSTVRPAEVHHETSNSVHQTHSATPTQQQQQQQQKRQRQPWWPCDANATDIFTDQQHTASGACRREDCSDGASTVSIAHLPSGSSSTETDKPLGATQQQQQQQQLAYCDAHTADTFARGRIINFVRRMGHSTGAVFHVHAMTPAQAAAVTGSATGPTLYSATCQLPLPEPHGSRVAEGVAEDAKEAEVLAAMHAERVCDALGVQLFRLRTAQQKHADAVRKEEGRYAPYPDDPVKPRGTPVPPPLRLLRTRRLDSSREPTVPSAQEGFPGAVTATAAKQGKSPLSRTPPAQQEAPRASEVSSSSSSLAEKGLGDGVSPPCSGRSSGAAGGTMKPDSTKIVLRRHDPVDDYARCVPHYTDDQHAERVRAYANSVYYPWMCQWEEVAVAQVDACAALKGGAMHNDGSSAGMSGPVFDPSESGMWSMVNERDMRCSPTPQDALVLPIVYDGPCAEARITDYYLQHNTSLKENLTVCTAAGSTGSPQRMIQAELRLIGLTVTAKGKAQTEQMAIHLAAMHAELLLDALGHPLFPADPQRQARHAEAVAGYGRWAMNPLTGRVTSPNPHDALPLPLKIQIGTDEIWLRPEAQRQLGHRWSDSERIIVAMQQLNTQIEDEIEINPPAELLEEAEQMLQDWQAHIAKSRFTHLFVLFNMENAYQATTILPVPRQFGIRGGLGIGKTRKMAVQVCSLHALDTLCALGVPLCVDAERERRYLQRRAALGMVLRNASPTGDGSQNPPRASWGFSGLLPSPLCGAAGQSPAMNDGGVPRLPTYVVEGSHIRLLPRIADTLHAMQQRIPEDYCLFGGAKEEMLVEIGNQVRLAVQNYLQDFLMQLVRSRNNQHGTRSKNGLPRTPRYPGAVSSEGEGVPVQHSSQGNETHSVTGADESSSSDSGDDDTASRPVARTVEDNIAETQAWATQFDMNILPHNMISGYGRNNSLHNTSFLQVPIPSSALSPLPVTSHEIDASAVSSPPPHPLVGPVYAIAIGTSLKRKDAERACYLHAASILHSFGVDVLTQFPRGLPRVRQVFSFADAAKYLSKEPLIITSPFFPDGTLRSSVEGTTFDEPIEAATSSPLTKTESDNALAASPAPPPGSLHPPRPVMHTNMKEFLESARGITLPRKRKLRPSSAR